MVVSASTVQAQDDGALLSSQRAPLRLTMQPAFQQYTDAGTSIRQWSTTLHAGAPFGRSTYARMFLSYASAQASEYEGVSGLNDFGLAVTHQRTLGQGSFIFNLSASAPVGKKGLNPDELQTTVLLSQNFYTFSVPSFGQGFNVAPGVTWAYPLSDGFVVGLGTAFRYRGAYRPVARMENAYRPGHEVLLSGGLDVRIRSASALSLDVTRTFFGMDTVGGEDWFQAGNETAATVQYLSRRDFTSIRLRARYVTNGRSTIPVLADASASPGDPPDDDLSDYTIRTVPQEIVISGQYRTRVRSGLHVTAHADASRFGETAYYEQRNVATGGVSAAWGVHKHVVLLPRVGYTAGSFTGLDVGFGIRYEQ